MDALTLTIDQAVTGLRKRRFPTADEDLFYALGRVQVAGMCAWVLGEYRPDLLDETPLSGSALSNLLAGESGLLAVEEQGLMVLEQRIPLIDPIDHLLNLEGETFCLTISPQGLSDSFEDTYENLDDPDNWPDEPLLVMAKYLNICAGEDAWERARERFQLWPERNPKQTEKGPPRFFNNRKFSRRLLKIAPLSGLLVAFEIAWQGTDNIFLDYDYEIAYMNAVPFERKHVKRLQDEWSKAQELLRQYQEAANVVDGEMLDEIVRAWDACCDWSQRNRQEARTLVEVFGTVDDD